MDIAILVLVVGLIGFIVVDKYVLSKKTEDEGDDRLEKEIEKKEEECRGLRDEMRVLRKEKDMTVEQKNAAHTEVEKLQYKVDDLNKKVAGFEANKEFGEQGMQKRITELSESRKSLEEERMRIRQEKEDKKKLLEEKRTRMWNEHENSCISFLRALCDKPEFYFKVHDNTTLPESFDGTLKPDFLIEFLGKYVVIDAKVSHAQDISTYLKTQVKSTAKKIQKSGNSADIYRTVFFVVPGVAIDEINPLVSFEDGFSFFVVSKESLIPVLWSLKQIEASETLEEIDPRERENLINLIASYDLHIRRQNAINILSSMEGVRILEKKEELSDDFKESVDNVRGKMRIENFKPTDLKKYISDIGEQGKGIAKVVKPKGASVEAGDLGNEQLTIE